MSWLFKQNFIFNRQKLIPFLQKYQKNLFYSSSSEENIDSENENYRIHFPYSKRSKNEERNDELRISKITIDDYEEAASRMNDFFWDNSLVKAFKIKKNDINQRILYNMWLNHLNENLSLKSNYSRRPNNINGIIISSPHVQSHEYTELLDLADMAETKELQNYFLALSDIVKKPKIYSEYSNILEINGIGVDVKERRHGIGRTLLNETLLLGQRNGFHRLRCDCTNCKAAGSLFNNDWQQISKIPFNHYANMDKDNDMPNDHIKIYEKVLDPPKLER